MGKKLVLAVAGMAALPMVACAMHPQLVHAQSEGVSTLQKFDVASIKLNKSKDTRPPQNAFRAVPGSGRLTITNMTVAAVIKGA